MITFYLESNAYYFFVLQIFEDEIFTNNIKTLTDWATEHVAAADEFDS